MEHKRKSQVAGWWVAFSAAFFALFFYLSTKRWCPSTHMTPYRRFRSNYEQIIDDTLEKTTRDCANEVR